MKLGIMQPYFFPYIGYFQLINAVDEFVIYDNIEFTKKGWINRNRILVNGTDSVITLSLKKDSDYAHIKDRFLADNWEIDRKKILNRITESYRKAPYFNRTYEVLEKCILFEDRNLFNFIFNSIKILNQHLNINSKLKVSSTIAIDHHLRSADKIMAICKAEEANVYINPIGGAELYNKNSFNSNGIKLYFLKANNIIYDQFKKDFVPSLSIVDVLMFNSKEDIIEMLNNYTLI